MNGVKICGTFDPCECCETMLLAKEYIEVPLIVDQNNDRESIKFCKQCFEGKGLAIRVTEDYSEYISRLIKSGICVQKKKPS